MNNSRGMGTFFFRGTRKQLDIVPEVLQLLFEVSLRKVVERDPENPIDFPKCQDKVGLLSGEGWR